MPKNAPIQSYGTLKLRRSSVTSLQNFEVGK